MSSNVILALSVLPILLAAGIDQLYADVRPQRSWVLRTHAVAAVVVVPVLIGVLAASFTHHIAAATGTVLLTAGEIGLTYGVLVLIWALRTALESVPASFFRR